MATKFYKFYGDAKWAKVLTPDEKYDNYALDLFMDGKSFELFKKSGLQLKIKENEDGKYVSLRRPTKKLIKGDLVDFGPPPMVDALGRPFAELVGNGSKVAVEVAVYDTQKGKGHRMEKVHVLEHVPYGGRMEDAHDDEEEAEAPGKNIADVKEEYLPKKGRIIDDEIPF